MHLKWAEPFNEKIPEEINETASTENIEIKISFVCLHSVNQIQTI